jgi:hypothetical protein
VLKKLQIAALALGAVLAFGAAMASSAFAVDEWLVGGNTIEGTLEIPAETKGEILLIHLAGLFEPEVVLHCHGIFDGTLLAAGADLISALLSLSGAAISLTAPLTCESLAGCEKPAGGEDVQVAPENLPWATQLTLDGAIFLDLFFQDSGSLGKPAYEIVNCLILGSPNEALCEGETSAEITLDPTTLLGIFRAEEIELEGLEGLCEMGTTNHEKVALQEGEGEISSTSGTLDVSGT